MSIYNFIKSKAIPVIVLLGLFSITNSNAQQDSQYTQYMYNTTTINPAYAGSRGLMSINALYRTQWVGLNGAPETLNASIHTPVGYKGVGLGFSFINDKIGPSQETNLAVDFSYTINTSEKTKLSFGLKGGFNMLDVNITDSDLIIGNTSDPGAENTNETSPTIGAGIYWHSDNWYIGLSAPNVLVTKHYDESIESSATEEAHFYLTGGYVFDLSANTKFKPAVLAKAVSGAPIAVDASANFLFYDKLTLGAAYRWDAAVSALVGFQVSDQIMIGYGYDYDSTEIGDFNSGSHEIFLRFEFFNNALKVINPRFF